MSDAVFAFANTRGSKTENANWVAGVSCTAVDPRAIRALLSQERTLAALDRGIEQALRGEIHHLGSFAEFADDKND